MAYNEHSAYPHPEEFEVMRPEYNELEDGYWQAVIHVSPFKVAGRSMTKAGARRAALYESQKTYYSYHPVEARASHAARRDGRLHLHRRDR